MGQQRQLHPPLLGLLWKKRLPELAGRPSGAIEAPGKKGRAGSDAHPPGCAVGPGELCLGHDVDVEGLGKGSCEV